MDKKPQAVMMIDPSPLGTNASLSYAEMSLALEAMFILQEAILNFSATSSDQSSVMFLDSGDWCKMCFADAVKDHRTSKLPWGNVALASIAARNANFNNLRRRQWFVS